jgi:uncharacterized DUF497 family protein
MTSFMAAVKDSILPAWSSLAFSTGIHYSYAKRRIRVGRRQGEGQPPQAQDQLRAASRVFDDPLVLIEQDLAEDYGEDRFLATGLIEGLLITVAYTERDDRVRIISARKASTDEQRAYDQG